jgi:polysaccharide biosynthesis protein PslG
MPRLVREGVPPPARRNEKGQGLPAPVSNCQSSSWVTALWAAARRIPAQLGEPAASLLNSALGGADDERMKHVRSGGTMSNRRPRVQLVVLLLLVAMATFGGPNSSPWSTAQAAPALGRPGLLLGFSQGNLVGLGPTDLNKELDALKAAHASVVRFDISWAVIQGGGPTSWNWAPVDSAIRGARARGMAVIPVLGYTPAWARVAGCQNRACRPTDNNAFATFAAAAVNRYKALGVNTWEIWNEPNSTAFQPQPSGKTYAALLIAAYRAIHVAQPSAVVLVGGLAPAQTTPTGNTAPADFVAALYAAGAGKSFDGVAMHPYSFPALPGEGQPWAGWSQMIGVHAVMGYHGDGAKGIWATEFGAPTAGPRAAATMLNRQYSVQPDHVAAPMQDSTLAAALQQSYYEPWLKVLLWYNLADTSAQTNSNQWSYGLLSQTGTPKPAYRTWLAAASARG